MHHADDRASFGALLRRCRLAGGLTQESLAERSRVAKRTLQELERDAARPRRETVRRLIAALQPLPEVRVQFEMAISAPRRHPGTARPLRADAEPGGNRTRPARHGAATSPPTPLRLTSFIGREREIADVGRLLRTSRLLTLTGSGGCGKTRLALELADRYAPSYPDGVYVVWLAALADPVHVASAMAQSLGVQEVVGEPLVDTVARRVGGKRMLLVVDNIEHLLPASPMLADLLAACPELTALVTSREVLRLQGEQVYPIAPLSLPHDGGSPSDRRRDVVTSVLASEAGRLFVDRARSAQPDFPLDAPTASAIAEICLRLDGLPLAIELAAARVRLLPPQAMIRKLEHRLPLLTGGARDLPARQRTLRDTVAWSYDLLDEQERRLFRRLAAFQGGWTVEAAEAVCDLGDLTLDVLDGLDALVAKSLIEQRERGGTETRFGMLETIREYGLEMLEAAGEAAETRRRHLAYFVERVEQAEPQHFGPDVAATVRTLMRDHDNVRAALAWSLTDRTSESIDAGLRLASAFELVWFQTDQIAEARHWLERVLAMDTARRLAAGSGAGLTAMFPEEARAGLRPPRRCSAGQHPRVAALNMLAVVLNLQFYPEQTIAWSIEALVLAHAVGDSLGIAQANGTLAQMEHFRGDYARSKMLAEEALRLGRILNDDYHVWRALQSLGQATMALGDLSRSRHHVEEALEMARAAGDLRGSAQETRLLGQIACHEGDLPRAAECFEESLTWWAKLETTRGPHTTLCEYGHVLFALGELDRAQRRFRESLTLSQLGGDRMAVVRCFDGIAAALVMTSGPAAAPRAARLLGAAAALRASLGLAIRPFDRATHEQGMAATRAALDEHAFEAAWLEGQAMTLEQAIAYALDETLPA